MNKPDEPPFDLLGGPHDGSPGSDLMGGPDWSGPDSDVMRPSRRLGDEQWVFPAPWDELDQLDRDRIEW
jgi:hypothetical protein